MGLDIRDVQLVVHIGCPKSILSYWQEAGRCARDGRQRFSLILYDGYTLALKITDKDMAAVVKNDSKTCIRKLILETLGDENMSMSQTSSCEGCDLQIYQERCKFDVHSFSSTSPVNEDCLARRL